MPSHAEKGKHLSKDECEHLTKMNVRSSFALLSLGKNTSWDDISVQVLSLFFKGVVKEFKRGQGESQECLHTYGQHTETEQTELWNTDKQ